MSKNSKIKVYIAAPFFNEQQLNVVKRIEARLKDEGIEYFSPRSEGILKSMSQDQRKKMMGQLFRSNIDRMDWCTHCIAVIDDYDTGVMFEFGYLYATHKKIVSFSNNYHGINVMLNEAIEAHCVNYNTLVDGLKGLFEGVKTDDVI